MEIFRKAATIAYIVVPLIDAADRPSYKASPTIAGGDVKVIRYIGGTWTTTIITNAPTAITGATTQLLITLTATEMTVDNTIYPIIVQFIDQSSTKEWDDQEIIIWSSNVDADITKISGDITAANNLEAQYDGTGLTGSTFPAQQTQAADILIDTASLISDVTALLSGLGVVDGNVDSIVAKLPSGIISDYDPSIDTADGITHTNILQMVLAMVNGRFKKDFPSAGQITFYKRDNVTALFTVTVSTTERTRV